MSCRVLECDYKITNNYTNHYNKVVNQKLGWAIGTDVIGTPKSICNVTAHSDGTVIKVVDYMDGTNMKNDREGWGFGNYVVILHGQRIDGKWVATEYCHLAHVNNIKEGQRISKGQILGLMGNTGSSYGAHLHFSYRVYSVKPTSANVHNKAIFVWENPETYLNSDLPMNTVKAEYKINGIDYSAVFDPKFYLNNYSDLKAAFSSDYNKTWNHFKQYGMKEARQANKDFNVSVYKSNYEDLRNAFGSNMPAYYQHYCQYGKKEGRNATTLINNYESNTTPNRFKVSLNGVQKGAYTDYKKACSYADSIGGVVLDGNQGMKQIYP